MDSYYSERNNLRSSNEKTYTMNLNMYTCLFTKCQDYFDCLANIYQKPTLGENCIGSSYPDMRLLSATLLVEIPNLSEDPSGIIAIPDELSDDDQYALLDLIEFMFKNIRDLSPIELNAHHGYRINSPRVTANDFRKEINKIFNRAGLLYTLTEKGRVERIPIPDLITPESLENVKKTKETGLKKYIQEAVYNFRDPKRIHHQDAVRDIWLCFERMKTYYGDKKKSTNQIIDQVSNDDEHFAEVLNREFKELTNIGNNFSIRHSETTIYDVKDERWYDYFFNRCYSLISFVIQYLE